jgi:predicted Zn-dependent peptidase
MRGFCIAALAAIALALAAGAAGTAEKENGEDGFRTLVKQVREFQLPNGLTFVVLERREAPIFSFRTYVDVGGVDEVVGITGLAHMFEHMAFKGTPHIGTTDYEGEMEALAKVDDAWADLIGERRMRHDADSTRIAEFEAAFKAAQAEAGSYVVSNEFTKVLEQAGVNGLNAMTGVDVTMYLYNLPSNKLELWALLEGDRLANPVLREFYKERDVVIEERRAGTESTPADRLYQDLMHTAFVAHPYRDGLIGHRSDLETFSRDEAEEFHRKHYVAKNMTVAVVGDVEFDEVKRLAEKYFSGVSEGPAPPPVDTVEPPQRAERRILMEDDAQPIVFLGYHIPDANDPRVYAYESLSDVLTGGRSSRLYTSLVKEQKIAVQVGSTTGFPGEKYPNLMFFYIVPASGVDPDSALAALDAELASLLDEAPVTDEELDGVKTRTRARFWRQIQSNQGMAGQLAYFHGMTGDWRNLFKQVDLVNEVAVEDVMSAAKECFRRENRTVAILRQKSEGSS